MVSSKVEMIDSNEVTSLEIGKNKKVDFWGKLFSEKKASNFLAIVLLAISTLVLMFKLDYPESLYNWENYTIMEIFSLKNLGIKEQVREYARINDGLISESGFSPFVGLPIRLIGEVFGFELWKLRIWSALCGIISILLLYLVSRSIFGIEIAFFSALFLLSSQAFLVYSRTAINVGPSLIPSLLTIYLIFLIWRQPFKIKYYFFLFCLLFINSFFYAPIRLLTPFSLGMVLVNLIMRLWIKFKKSLTNFANRKRILFLLLFLLLGMFSAMSVVSVYTHRGAIFLTLLKYYSGGGEHIVAKYAAAQEEISQQGAIFRKNLISWGKLYLSIDTSPTVTDYWNPRGQIVIFWLVPLFYLGLIVQLLSSDKFKSSLILGWFLVTSVPIIFTNNVHSGRLFFSLLPLYIFVSIGFFKLINLMKEIVKKIGLGFLSLPIVSFFCICFSLLLFHNVVKDYFSIAVYLQVDSIKTKIEENRHLWEGRKLILVNIEPTDFAFWRAYYYLGEDYIFESIRSPEKKVNWWKNTGRLGRAYFIEKEVGQDEINDLCGEEATIIIVGNESAENKKNYPCRERMIFIN